MAAVLVLLELPAREQLLLLTVGAERFPASQALLWSMAVVVEGRRARPRMTRRRQRVPAQAVPVVAALVAGLGLRVPMAPTGSAVAEVGVTQMPRPQLLLQVATVVTVLSFSNMRTIRERQLPWRVRQQRQTK